MKRKSFILHLDSLDVVKELTTEQKADLFQAIIDYNLGNEVKLSGLMNAIFIPFKNQFSRDNEKYNDIVNRNKNNGLKGGRPKTETNPNKPKKTQWDNSKPKKPDNVNDNDNDNENDNENDNVIVLIANFKKWNVNDFQNDISLYKELYISEMLNRFYTYWSEKTPSGKMRFQLEKTWETSKRLITWKNNQKAFDKAEQTNRGGSTKVKAL